MNAPAGRFRGHRLALAASLCTLLSGGVAANGAQPSERTATAPPPESGSDPPSGPIEVLDDGPVPDREMATPETSPVSPVVFNGFTSVQVNVDALGNNLIGDAANEPSIAIDPTAPNRMAIGWRQFDSTTSNFRQAGWAYSHDGGRTWTFPGVLEPGVYRSDPVLDADGDGNLYFHSLTTNQVSYSCDLFKSTDHGRTWGAGVYAYGGDKAWMAIDHSGDIRDGNIYAAWDNAGCCGNDWFNRSTDQGASFESPVPVPQQPIWGVTAVGPDGEVYIAGRRRSTNTQFVVAKSTSVRDKASPLAFDAAVQVNLEGTLEYFLGTGPNPGGLLGQVWVAVDRSGSSSRGNVYVLSSVNPPGSDPLDVHFVRSTDGGQSWSTPLRVNDDPAGTNAWQWFGTLDVAPNGRIDVVWNDTRADFGGVMSQLYYSYSTDTGNTWSQNEPVGPPFHPHLGWPDQAKLGDYYDIVSDRVGVHVAYAATYNGGQDVYYLRIGDYDCNDNGVGDAAEIDSGSTADDDANGIPDACEDGDGDDLVAGRDNCPSAPNPDQLDSDADEVGDACDNCPGAANPDQADSDDNGIGDLCDSARTILVDIKPGSSTNPIQLSSNGRLPVAILTTSDLDAAVVIASTLCFGDAEDPAERNCTEAHGKGHLEDVDRDGDLDLVLHFDTRRTGIDAGDARACLTGRTLDGTAIEGCDAVRTTP